MCLVILMGGLGLDGGGGEGMYLLEPDAELVEVGFEGEEVSEEGALVWGGAGEGVDLLDAVEEGIEVCFEGDEGSGESCEVLGGGGVGGCWRGWVLGWGGGAGLVGGLGLDGGRWGGWRRHFGRDGGVRGGGGRVIMRRQSSHINSSWCSRCLCLRALRRASAVVFMEFSRPGILPPMSWPRTMCLWSLSSFLEGETSYLASA